jgi:2-dehydro-3-deoxyphosphooctonate aldolase (KDO 8-P synthase)
MGVSKVRVGGVEIGGGDLVLIGGPCVIEDLDTCLTVARRFSELCSRRDLGYIFKSSFEKDNRSSASSYRGPGLERGLDILAEVRSRTGVPVLSDVHYPRQVGPAAEVLDVLQIPAYLSQQTELALEAGRTGKPINIKKAQFIAPEDMAGAVEKVRSTGNDGVILTERGSCFGYRRLVVDVRSFPLLRSLGCPVVFDVTHAIRIYGYPSSDPRGGEPRFVAPLARAAVACGVDGLFVETHPDPCRAKCDAVSMLPLDSLKGFLDQVTAIHRAAVEFRDE